MNKKDRPEWTPKQPNQAFTTNYLDGIEGGHDGMSREKESNKETRPARSIPRRRKLTVDDYVNGVLEGNRAIIAQAITLVESNSQAHMEIAQEVLQQLMPHTGNSVRIGFTGVPGAGKSTLIESFGSMLCERGHKVAVLAVDPSSSVSRGSILGDKTRMEQLSRNKNAFVRPSPSSGTLGGVARKSRETLLICEAAGFDVIIVETVGVGQSEITVRSMVDFFLVLMLTGAGDELQGMKKGVMEIADAIFINKADGQNKQAALNAKVEYNRLLHYLQPATEGWETKAYTVSALTGEGVPTIWDVVHEYKEITVKNGLFEERRRKQTLDWMKTLIEDQLMSRFYQHPEVVKSMPMVEQNVIDGKASATLAVRQLLDLYDR
ncbi:methylmalonyl Co-A mutase-associated GTPase MeaB [Desertibacillus haloalkaliphilus]|nr:methylmalonyl Co-A mutase-associated GTPase MeaB [Desertibacillus haloalkaliphilus]MBU8904986.1 methylmalonyl Co-A mutase-associated GTPase MeaB [Desertibacillus haloalkaliphilus]